MADFSQAFAKTMSNEGGYSNNSNDRGGETYCGISRVNFPDWPGWSYLDRFPSPGSAPENLASVPQLQAQLQAFYRSQFWNQIYGDQMGNQSIANKLFDMAVNMGVGQAVKILQEAIVVVSGRSLVVDGRIGPMTIAAMATIQPTTLLNAIRIDHGNFYLDLIRKDPSQRVFVNGWLIRATS
jgi:lysozyme family protein